MKKILFVIFLSLLCLLSSCEIESGESDLLESTANEVIRCFNEDDVDALKLLFCQNTLNEAVDIEMQIENAFECYDGKSESYDFHYLGFDGCCVDGKWIDKHSTVKIKNIKTSSEKMYWITYTEYIIYDNDSGKIGIIGMSLRDENLNVIAEIG